MGKDWYEPTHKLPPPPDDGDARHRRRVGRKHFGIETTYSFGERTWTSCSWYETENQRDQALADARKQVPPVAGRLRYRAVSR